MSGKDHVRRPGQYSGLRLSGEFFIRARYPNGAIALRQGKNLVTNAGETLVAQLLDVNTVENKPEYLAFGSGTEGALKTDTELQTEITAEPRMAADSTVQNSNTLQLEWNITAGAPYTVQEMGVFNAITGGTMFSRFLTQPLGVVAAMTIDITWNLTISGVD